MKAGRRFWVVYALIWAVAVPPHAFVLARQAPVTIAEAATSAVSTVGIAALLGALVWSVTARLPLATGRRFRFAATHAVLALTYGALWFGIQYLLLRLAAGPQTADLVARLSGLWTVLYGMFLYGAVASAFYVVRSQRALRLQQVAAAQAQLVALRAQLNPHFLFNALHSVAALVRHDARAAEAALDRLGQLLRYALDEGAGETVYLADEWAFVSDYLEMETLRLGERLHLATALDDDALDCRVPPFILQPLVENAVRHGIAVRTEGGCLRVEARRRDERLVISVEDDGPGADPAALASASGLGLKGVRRQVEARYGARGRVTVTTEPGRGFRVDVEIPA